MPQRVHIADVFANPYTYLNYLFEKLPNLDSTDDETLDQLLPWNVKIP
jgi:transposase